jgi:hypothetical protein
VVFSILDPKAFYRYIIGVLPLSIGVNLVFRGIIDYKRIKLTICKGYFGPYTGARLGALRGRQG